MIEIVIALIAPLGAIVVCLINNHSQEKRFETQMETQRRVAEEKHHETIDMISYKLDQLTKKVDLHNNAVERLYVVERKLDVDEEKIKVCGHRIDDLEQFHR